MARFIITGEYKDKATRAARKDLKGLAKDTEFFGKYAKKYWGIASAAASYYAQRALRQSIKNALEDEKSQRVLALTLANVASATDAAVIATEQQIAAMQSAYGVVDDQLRPALARLARSSGSASQAVYDLKLALDISAATGKSLEAVTGALGKALDGNYASLQRLGLGLDQSLIKSKDQKKIFDQLRKTFAGFAANEAATTEGKFRRIAVAADEAKEIIGVALIDSINRLVSAQGNVDGLAKSFESMALYIADVARGLTDVVMAVQKLGDYIPDIVKNTGKWVWQNMTIVGLLQKQGKQTRINTALIKSQSAQVISARNAEMVALKKSKEAGAEIAEGTKKTVEQLMAEEAARKAGFKLTEDIDSIQTVAAAKRLEEARQYKAQVLDAAQAQFEAVKNNYNLLNAVWQTQLTAFDAFLAALKTKAAQSQIQIGVASAVGSAAAASVVNPFYTPTRAIDAYMAMPESYMGSSYTPPSFNNQPNVTVNVNAGVIAEQERLVSAIASAVTQNYRSGNPILPAGYIGG